MFYDTGFSNMMEELRPHKTVDKINLLLFYTIFVSCVSFYVSNNNFNLNAWLIILFLFIANYEIAGICFFVCLLAFLIEFLLI